MIVYGFCITWISKDRDFTGLKVFNSVFRISIHLANKTRIGRCSVGMCMQTNDVLCDRTTVWDPHQKFNQEKLEMVQRRAARFVKSRYKRTDSVTAMLDELGWPILSKRRKDARLILFYKIINNLAQVPHEHILIKAYEGTRKKNNHKFRHVAVNTSQYRQSFFPKTVGPWNQLSFADSPTL